MSAISDGLDPFDLLGLEKGQEGQVCDVSVLSEVLLQVIRLVWFEGYMLLACVRNNGVVGRPVAHIYNNSFSLYHDVKLLNSCC